MRAVQFERYGSADVLALQILPMPAPKSGQVLVEVVAASVNPKDTFVRKGRFRRLTGKRFPLNSGYDAAGVIVKSTVATFLPGDAVFGMLNGWGGGAASEFVAWPADELAIAPASMSLADAAALPLAAQTALQGLRDHLKVKPGQSVLINGASGGVGSFAVQIAKTLGADVVAVCSPEHAEHVMMLGADAFHDYAHGLPIRRFDGVFDVFGNLSAQIVAPILVKGGRYVTTVPSANNIRATLAVWRHPQTRIVNVRSRSADLRALAAMVDAGLLQVVIDARFPLTEVIAAHRHVEGKHTKGKVVLDIADKSIDPQK